MIGCEQPVVDDDVSANPLDAGGLDLAGKLVERGERVAALDDRGAGKARVGVVVVDLGKTVEGERPVRLVAQPEAEIARRDKDEVPPERCRA